MTISEWLKLPKAELDIELAKVLTPEHDWHGNHYGTVCHKCYDYKGDETTPPACSVPNPIDSDDWNVAMEWFRKFGRTRENQDTIAEIHRDIYDRVHIPNPVHISKIGLSEGSMSWWWKYIAQPKHYLIAAAVSKEKK